VQHLICPIQQEHALAAGASRYANIIECNNCYFGDISRKIIVSQKPPSTKWHKCRPRAICSRGWV